MKYPQIFASILGGIMALATATPDSTATAADLVMQSGPQLYRQFCASCHGVTGRGDGPVAPALGIEVPDLTRIAQRHSGSFDRAMVEAIIDGRRIVGAHGTRTMPVWGEDLSRSELGNPDAERTARLVITRIADYLWQLQHVVEPRRDP
jgi:mono/diheme cytochrome c family protein